MSIASETMLALGDLGLEWVLKYSKAVSLKARDWTVWGEGVSLPNNNESDLQSSGIKGALSSGSTFSVHVSPFSDLVGDSSLKSTPSLEYSLVLLIQELN